MSTNKIYIKTFVCILEGKIYSDMDKLNFGGLYNVPILCMFLKINIHNLYMYEHETIRNYLISYLIFYRLLEIWKQPIN